MNDQQRKVERAMLAMVLGVMLACVATLLFILVVTR
jgi:hypothetical protein